MKINYKNPKTGKPSTVNIADWWVQTYEKACSVRSRPDDNMRSLVDRVAYIYFCEGYPPQFPEFQTFTQAVEHSMCLVIRCALSE